MIVYRIECDRAMLAMMNYYLSLCYGDRIVADRLRAAWTGFPAETRTVKYTSHQTHKLSYSARIMNKTLFLYEKTGS